MTHTVDIQTANTPTITRSPQRGPKRRTTKFTGALVAFSVVVASFAATPARADDADVARALGGLFTLFVIGKAIDNANDKPKSTTVYRKPAPKPHTPIVIHRKPTVQPGQHVSVSKRRKPTPPKASHSDAFKIPNHCVVTARDGKRRAQTVALESCVVKSRKSARSLPNACEVRVHTKHGRGHAYELGCLTNFGYRVARS